MTSQQLGSTTTELTAGVLAREGESLEWRRAVQAGSFHLTSAPSSFNIEVESRAVVPTASESRAVVPTASESRAVVPTASENGWDNRSTIKTATPRASLERALDTATSQSPVAVREHRIS